MGKRTGILFVWWIVLMPFISVFLPQEQATLVWFAVGCTIWSVWLAIYWRKIRPDRGDLWYLLWLAVAAVSSGTGIDPTVSFVGPAIRMQVVLFFWGLWVVRKTATQLIREQQQVLFGSVAYAAVIEALIIVIQFLSARFLPVKMLLNGRPTGTFGEPNMAAGFMAVAAACILYETQKTKFTRNRWGMLALVTTAIILTGSRSGVLAVGTVVIGVILTATTKRRRRHGALWRAGSVVALVSVIFVFRSLFQHPPSLYEDRLLIWQVGWRAFELRPWLGYGLESTAAVYRHAFFAYRNIRLLDLTVDRSHMLVLDLLLWSGIAGLVIFSGWMVHTIRRLFAGHERARLWAVAAWLVFAMLQPVGTVQWVLLAVLAS